MENIKNELIEKHKIGNDIIKLINEYTNNKYNFKGFILYKDPENNYNLYLTQQKEV